MVHLIVECQCSRASHEGGSWSWPRLERCCNKPCRYHATTQCQVEKTQERVRRGQGRTPILGLNLFLLYRHSSMKWVQGMQLLFLSHYPLPECSDLNFHLNMRASHRWIPHANRRKKRTLLLTSAIAIIISLDQLRLKSSTVNKKLTISHPRSNHKYIQRIRGKISAMSFASA